MRMRGYDLSLSSRADCSRPAGKTSHATEHLSFIRLCPGSVSWFDLAKCLT
jgi:hypothetical protein